MVRKKKCKVCGFKFRLDKENRYLTKKSTSLTGSLTEKPTIFEMFDCPNCGCQNAVGICKQPIEENKKRAVMEFDSEKFKQAIEENKKKERIIKMTEKVVIKIKKVNGANVIKIKGNPKSKYHINLMAQKLRLGEIKPTKMLRIKRFFKKLNRVVKQLAEEISTQPKYSVRLPQLKS